MWDTESMKPLLLLDVDGVLNVFGALPAAPADVLPAGAVLEAHGRYDLLLFPERHTAHLAALAEAFEIHWCTMWEGQANARLADTYRLAAYLPVVPLLDAVDWTLPSFKAPAIAEYVGGRPFAWVDDDAYDDALDHFNEKGLAYYVVRTDPSVGLIDEQVRRLLTWAGECV